MRFLSRTPIRTFVVYPTITLVWELYWSSGNPDIVPGYTALMLWGYFQYRLCGRYRMKQGGGGPGIEVPPRRLVLSGPYAYTRNPMYLGHVIFLIGLTLTLESWLAACITIAVAIWLHIRVLADEKKLAASLGPAYIAYTQAVKRWVPGLF